MIDNLQTEIIPRPGPRACPDCLTEGNEMQDEQGWFFVCPIDRDEVDWDAAEAWIEERSETDNET